MRHEFSDELKAGFEWLVKTKPERAGDVYLSIYNSSRIDPAEPDKKIRDLKSFFSCVGRRRKIDGDRKEKRHGQARVAAKDLDEAGELAGATEPGSEVEAKDFVAVTLPRLAPRDRQLLEMRYLEDLSVEEVSERLGRPYEATKKALQRALVAAREQMGVKTS